MPVEAPAVSSSADGGEQWVAEYDYAAADADEVSFNEGDNMIEVTIVGEGWVTVRCYFLPVAGHLFCCCVYARRCVPFSPSALGSNTSHRCAIQSCNELRMCMVVCVCMTVCVCMVVCVCMTVCVRGAGYG